MLKMSNFRRAMVRLHAYEVERQARSTEPQHVADPQCHATANALVVDERAVSAVILDHCLPVPLHDRAMGFRQAAMPAGRLQRARHLRERPAHRERLRGDRPRHDRETARASGSLRRDERKCCRLRVARAGSDHRSGNRCTSASAAAGLAIDSRAPAWRTRPRPAASACTSQSRSVASASPARARQPRRSETHDCTARPAGRAPWTSRCTSPASASTRPSICSAVSVMRCVLAPKDISASVCPDSSPR